MSHSDTKSCSARCFGMEVSLARPLLVVALVPLLLACMWDSETTREEIRGLPSFKDAVYGKYPVHTAEYWNWRIATAKRVLAKSPRDFGAMNNLAVAHEKLGDTERAIEIMREKLALDEDEYTTHANLGTFLIHRALKIERSISSETIPTDGSPTDGVAPDSDAVTRQLSEGLLHLRRAVEINPEAHFGREKYQIMAVEWVLRVREDPSLGDTTDFLNTDRFVRNLSLIQDLEDAGLGGDVLSGVIGMMRFGGVDGAVWPEFYRVLARLGDKIEYRQMSIAGPDLLGRSGDSYIAVVSAAARRALDLGRTDPALVRLVKDLDRELYDKRLLEAKAWREAYQSHERQLLARGLDPTEHRHWTEFYEEHGNFMPLVEIGRAGFLHTLPRYWWLIIILILMGYGLFVAIRSTFSNDLGKRIPRDRRDTPPSPLGDGAS